MPTDGLRRYLTKVSGMVSVTGAWLEIHGNQGSKEGSCSGDCRRTVSDEGIEQVSVAAQG